MEGALEPKIRQLHYTAYFQPGLSVSTRMEMSENTKKALGIVNKKFLIFKKGDDIGQQFLKLVRELDMDDDMGEDGFYMKDADEMMLIYQCRFGAEDTTTNKLLGKIEFSKNGAYMNWIHTTPGNGVLCFNFFKTNVLEKRKINKTQFILSIDPTESKETTLRRLNFYMRKIEAKVAIIDVNFKKETGAVQLVCEIGLK